MLWFFCREAQYADMGLKDRIVAGAKLLAYNHPKLSCLVFLVIILLSVHMVRCPFNNHFVKVQHSKTRLRDPFV